MTIPEGRFFEGTGFLPPMTSYAQNFEDVMLRRALRDIERGFYIDVGANHPIKDSTTFYFYEKGWRGINVEPNPAFARLLQSQRPRDINVGVAVGAPNQRKATLYVIGDTRPSTIDHVLAQQQADAGMVTTNKMEVEVVGLDRLLQAHEPIPTIDFLKIDAEGSEVSIIQSATFTQYRPRIILVETNGFEIYDPVLCSKGYHRVWFDGLNMFYVRDEDVWRGDLIARPVSVWDNATKSAQTEAEIERMKAEAEIERTKAEIERMKAEIERMKATLSWRITAPLRAVRWLSFKLRKQSGSTNERSIPPEQ